MFAMRSGGERPPMSYRYSDAGWFHRLNRWIGGTAVGARIYARILDQLDRLAFRLTRGRTTFAALVSGLPVVMLTTTGARSGQPRTMPVLGIPDGQDLIVIASNFGQRPHPGWYYNLRARPRATVTHEGARAEMSARLLEGEEYERCFQLAMQSYPGFAAYRRRAAHRHIGVFKLSAVG
jgi:deazaflavin-dependent oxidoreductase (nitroreductase family)